MSPTGIPTLTLKQPWATLVAEGVKTWETRSARTAHRGRILIHAGKGIHPGDVGGYVLGERPNAHDWGIYCRGDHPKRPTFLAPQGVIVASAMLTDCCPVGGPYSFRTGHVEGDEGDHPGQAVVVLHPPLHGEDLWTLIHDDATGRQHDITDQLPFGHWDTATVALALADVKPTAERCPWCWGSGWDVRNYNPGNDPDECGVCRGQGGCDPIPARGMPGWWRWSPT